MSMPDKIAVATIQKSLDAAEKKLKDQEKRIQLMLATMHRERAAKRVKLATAPRQFKLKGDIVRMTASDVHGSHMNKAAVAAFLGDVKVIQPNEIVLNGDIIDCGGFLAEHHTLGYVAETNYTYTDDCAAANGFLDSTQSAAPNALIEYLEGNHEDRVESWCCTTALRGGGKDAEFLRKAVAPEFTLGLAERGIKYYRRSICYDGLTVPGMIKRGKIYYIHGVSTAKAAAAEHLKKLCVNVNFGHTHRAQSDIVHKQGTGVIGAWNPGALCHHQPLWQHGNPTEWTEGFSIEFVSRTGNFLHLNVPIIGGLSHLTALLKYGPVAA